MFMSSKNNGLNKNYDDADRDDGNLTTEINNILFTLFLLINIGVLLIVCRSALVRDDNRFVEAADHYYHQ